MATLFELVFRGDQTFNTDESKQLKTMISPLGATKATYGQSSYAGHLGTRHGMGADHNRLMRAVNPIINQFSGGVWEKGNRLYSGAKNFNAIFEENGLKAALLGTGSVIAFQLILMEIIKYMRSIRQLNEKTNDSNYLKIANGETILGKNYKMSYNIITDKITYKNQ